MSIPLLQSTTATVKMGPAVDKTDGVTPKTVLTPTVYLSKNGAAFAARHSATAIAHDRDGYYSVEFDTTDTNTLGMLRAEFTDASTHLPVWEYFEVMASPSYFARFYGPLVRQFNPQAAGASDITLDLASSSVDNFYTGLVVFVQAGPGVGQSRRLGTGVGATRVYNVSSPWTVLLDATSDVLLLAG